MSGRWNRQADGGTWGREDVLKAVRDRLGNRDGWDSGWMFEQAELDGDRVLVVFRIEDQHRLGVLYDVADAPNGVNTSEPCDTPEEWADEIVWTMDEQIETGGLARAERTTGPD